MIFKGDDWRGTERATSSRSGFRRGVEVVYFPYTVHTSSTHLRALIAAARPA